MRQMTLSQKGVALVVITLVFQLSFVAGLALLLKNAEEQVQHERTVREVIFQISRLSGAIDGASVGFAEQIHNEDSPQSKRFQETYGQFLSSVSEHLQVLTDLTKDSPYTSEVQTLCADVRNGMQIMEACRKACIANVPERFGLGLQLSRMSRKITQEIEVLLQKYQLAQQEEMEKQSATRNVVIATLSAGIVLDILVALFLVITFTRAISKRIERVKDNAIRLAAGVPLLPAITTGDEIGLLDRTFHQAASILTEASQREQAVARLKQEFVAMVSHDLRAPLTSIQLIMELTEMGNYGELSEVGRNRLSGANAEINRLVGLVNGLLSIEKLESGAVDLELSTVLVSSVIEPSVLAVQGSAIRSGVEIVVENLSDPSFRVDPTRMTQVMVNLLSNAIKFSPQRGKVWVFVKKLSERVRVEVQDQGPGIPPDLQTSIFDRFKQVNRSDATEKGGTGLGLAICKTIVEQHNGAIGVICDTTGNGSIFWVEIPSQL